MRSAGSNLTALRLRYQRLSGGRFTRPEDVVSWLGAVQAQEYADTKWALALRMQRPTAAGIERAFAAGRILRTHVLRPTWHFVTPADSPPRPLQRTGRRGWTCRGRLAAPGPRPAVPWRFFG